jgi:DNA-binding response OmpR family regulator
MTSRIVPTVQICLDQFNSGAFDLCILDIMLPKIDGFELAASAKANRTSIIFLSAKTLKEDRIKGLRLGADDYLVKPFSIEELLLKIEVFLRRSNKAFRTIDLPGWKIRL